MNLYLVLCLCINHFLGAMVAAEGVPLHSPYFAKLWYEIYHSELDKNLIKTLCKSTYFMEYVEGVLLDERMSLNNQNIYQFFCNFFPKVSHLLFSSAKMLRSLYGKPCGPRSDCSYRSSLFWVHTVCFYI